MTRTSQPASLPSPPPSVSSPKNRLLPVIGGFKLVKAAVLFAAAYALHYLRHTDVERALTTWAHVIHFDPESYYIHRIISGATGIPPERLHHTGIGLFVYAVLFATEGTGLLLGKRWAEYVTVVTTSLLLPLEVFELTHPQHRAAKVAILVGNVAILAYLIWNLARTRRRDGAEPAAAPPGLQAPPV